MTEEGTPPVEGQAETTATTTAVPASIVNADGSLVEGWQKHAPEGYEDLREDKTVSTIKNVWDLSKSYVHVRKQVPMDKMPRPNEKWGDAEWEEFYKAAGKPETPQDYGNYDAPEWWDEQIMPWEQVQSDWQNTFFKLGLNPKQTEALVALNDRHNEIIQTAMTRMAQEKQDAISDALHDEWGRAYDQKVFRAEKVIERGANGDEGLHEYVLEKMKGDVQLMKWMSNMEDQFSEHEPVERANIPTPADLQQQIDEVRADPRFMSTDLRVRQPLIDKVNRLTEQLLKEKQPA